MRKVGCLKIVLGLSLVTLILCAHIVNVTAINDQGLVWGIEVNDRFDYVVEMEYCSPSMNLSLDDRMYVIIDELSTIPEHATELSDLTIFSLTLDSYTTYWENGSIMDDLWFDVMEMPNPFSAYPIGNWSLIAQIFGDAAPVVITQEATTMNYSLIDFPVVGNVHETIFIKSNGAPLSVIYNRIWDLTRTIHMNLTMIETPTTTDTNTGDGDSNLILILGIGTLVVAIVAIAIIRRK